MKNLPISVFLFKPSHHLLLSTQTLASLFLSLSVLLFEHKIHNVIFSFRSRKVTGRDSDVASSEQVLPLELDEDDNGFLLAKNPSFGFPFVDQRRHISFVREEREWVMVPRKSIDVPSVMALLRRLVSMVAPLFLVWLL